MTTPLQETFTFTSVINRETTYSNLKLADSATSEMAVTIHSNGLGFVEWYVEELDLHEEIGLEFTDNELTGYDGVFELPQELLKFMEKRGYNVINHK